MLGVFACKKADGSRHGEEGDHSVVNESRIKIHEGLVPQNCAYMYQHGFFSCSYVHVWWSVG